MNWQLQCPDGRRLPLAADVDTLVGASGQAQVKLPSPPERCALLHRNDNDVWLQVLTDDAQVGVNGRPVQRLSRLRAGDRVCFGGYCVDLLVNERPATACSEVADFFLRVRNGAQSGTVFRGPVLHLDGEGAVVSAAAGTIGLILADGAVRLDAGGGGVRLNGCPVTDEVVVTDGDQIQVGQRRYIVETLAAPPPELVTQRLPESDMPDTSDPALNTRPVPSSQTGGLWGLILLAAVIASGVAILLYFHNT